MRLPTLLLAAAVSLSLAACQPAAPTVTPTYTCTPRGEAPRVCSAEHKQAEVDHLKLVDEAEAVYRRMFEERRRLAYAGGATEPTPVLDETLDGTFKNQIMGFLRFQMEQRERYVGDFLLSKMTEVPPADGFLVALIVCEDGRAVEAFDEAGTKLGSGALVAFAVQLNRVDGRLKAVAARDSETTTCGA